MPKQLKRCPPDLLRGAIEAERQALMKDLQRLFGRDCAPPDEHEDLCKEVGRLSICLKALDDWAVFSARPTSKIIVPEPRVDLSDAGALSVVDHNREGG